MTVIRVAPEGEASLKLESVVREELSAEGEKRAGVAALEGLDPASSVVAGTIMVLVIVLWSVIVVAGRAATLRTWPARIIAGIIALVYMLV